MYRDPLQVYTETKHRSFFYAYSRLKRVEKLDLNVIRRIGQVDTTVPTNKDDLILFLIHLTLDRLKLSYFGKNDWWKMTVFRIFGSWDQRIDSLFTNHEPLIPTLVSTKFYRFFYIPSLSDTPVKLDLNINPSSPITDEDKKVT